MKSIRRTLVAFLMIALLISGMSFGMNSCGDEDSAADETEMVDSQKSSDEQASDDKAKSKSTKKEEKNDIEKKEESADKNAKSAEKKQASKKDEAEDNDSADSSGSSGGSNTSPSDNASVKKSSASSTKSSGSGNTASSGKASASSATSSNSSEKQKVWVDPVYKTVHHEEQGHNVQKVKCKCGIVFDSPSEHKAHQDAFIAEMRQTDPDFTCNGTHTSRYINEWVVDQPAWDEEVLVSEGHWEYQ